VKPVHYFICGTPRSGSTLLCEALRATRVAGTPGEYFADHFTSLLLKRWKVPSVPDYHAFFRLARGAATTPNGVCGIKLHWPQMEKLARVAGCTLPDLEAVEELFPNPLFMFLVRADKRAQAISHLRSEQTNQWSVPNGQPRHPSRAAARFDFERLETLQRMLAQHEANWDALFACRGIRPLRLYYEDLCADYEMTIRAALRFIGIDSADRMAIPPPPLVKQGGDESAWTQRSLVEARLRRAG